MVQVQGETKDTVEQNRESKQCIQTCALSLITKVALQWGIVFSEKDFESNRYPYENRILDPYPTQMSILEAMYNYMQKKKK